MSLDLARLQSFFSHLRIDSKEKGRTTLTLLGSQRYLLNEIVSGLNEGVHFFDVLKGRQDGISTVCLGLDLYWLMKYPGLQGTVVTDVDDNREAFRSYLTTYWDGLPRTHKVPIKRHNRAILEFANSSKAYYLVAGERKKKSGIGRGKGLNYVHATETCSWGDEAALTALAGSLASTNPLRLYIFESTALGYNVRYDMWQDAKNAISKKAIFVGWWRNELNDVPHYSRIAKVYGFDSPMYSEREWITAIKNLYDYEISPTQLAWWRWQLKEFMHGDEYQMFQEHPPTEDYAFVMSGYKFFRDSLLTGLKKKIEAPDHAPAQCYRYHFGPTFDQTEIRPCSPGYSHLKVWEEPDPLGYYAIGADPAYGSSTNKDSFCVQVFRCYADGVEQVAEYCTPEGATYSFAWVVAHLAGAYRNSNVILEITGPGATVFQELNRLTQAGGYYPGGTSSGALLDVLGNIHHYLYRRPDSLSGTMAYHWKTTSENKERIMNHFRDLVEREMADIHSEDLIEEMRFITNDEGDIGAGSARSKDDRVMAAALALEAYQAWVGQEVYERGLTRTESYRLKQMLNPTDNSPIAYSIANFMGQFKKPGEMQ